MNGVKYYCKYLKTESGTVFAGYVFKKDGNWIKFDNSDYRTLITQIKNDEKLKLSGIPVVAGSATILSLTPVGFGLSEGYGAFSILNKGKCGLFGLGAIVLGLFCSGLPSIYSGEGLVLPTLPALPVFSPAIRWQEPIPITIPITLPHAIPTDLPNKKPTDKDNCSVYVIWQVTKSGSFEVSKYGITCVEGQDGTQDCDRPESQCVDFNKAKATFDPNIAFYYWNWIIGGDGKYAKFSKVNYRTALIIEKSLTAAYLVGTGGILPPKHNLPCFKKDDPFNAVAAALERTRRAQKWIEDNIKLFGK
jgi:hypothetical protein